MLFLLSILIFQFFYTKKLEVKLEKEFNLDDKLKELKGEISEKELNKIYSNVYLKKAKKNYTNSNYKLAWEYLKKAELYDYNITKSEIYKQLMNLKEEEEKKQEQLESENNYEGNGEPMDYIVEKYFIPDSDTRYLEEEELIKYSTEELAWIRNEIFARHGYIFTNKEYSDYFYERTWYIPNENVKGDDSILSPIEKHNVDLIRRLEEEQK